MPKKARDPIFTTIWALTVLSFLCNFIAFVCPYWVERKAGSNNKFVSLGLWVSCFDGYMHDNIYEKAFYGCWYIFHKEYDLVRNWINPRKFQAWLFVTQVLAIISFICNLVNVLIVGCQTCDIIATDHIKFLKTQLACHAFSILGLLVGLIAFGVESQDSRWMPYPEKNTLSWAYGIEAFGTIIALVVLILLFYKYLVFTNTRESAGGVDYSQPEIEYQEGTKGTPAVYDPRAPPGIEHVDDSAV